MFGGGFPFGDIPMGGMPGGMGGGPPRRPKSDNTKYYELLGVDRSATEVELKKAHRKLALKHHPDKGGDPELFKTINQAYDVLKDPEKKRIYDQYGEDAINEGMGAGGGGGGFGDIFDMFGGGGGGGRSRGPQKGENVVHKLKVSLEELYSGGMRKLSLTRQVKCGNCSGSGSNSGAKHECGTCHGSGVQVVVRPLGPGVMQQMQQQCSKCGGAGSVVPAADRCSACGAKGLTPEKKIFEVHIEKGMRQHQKVIKHGEAGCTDPSLEPGDVVFVIEAKEHPRFKRAGADLIMEHTISLADALCGVDMHLRHLDDRLLHVCTAPGEVIKPDSWKCIEDEGMPVHGRPYSKGNLYIRFAVTFPESMSAESVAAVRSVLPGVSPGPSAMESDEVDDVTMRPIDDMEAELSARQRQSRSQQAYDSDEEEDGPGGRGGQRVQCAHQ